jgi:hypothetical protein
MQADDINSLPVDASIPSVEEAMAIDTLFKRNKSMLDSFMMHSKDVILVGALFVIFSIPQIRTLLGSMFPLIVKSPLIGTFILAVIVMILYFLVKNFALAKKE